MKVEPLVYGDKKVFTVAGFNSGVADWSARLPTLWIEGEVTELRRNANWASVFFTLRDPDDGACLASIPRRTFDALKLDLADGEIHVLGRPELYAAKGEFRLRHLSLERFERRPAPRGDRAAEADARGRGSLFVAARKRTLPRFPRRIGLVTAATRPRAATLTTIQTRFPPARVLVAETLAGPARRRRDRRGAAGAGRGARDRRDRPHARRRQLRRPAHLQRRAGGSVPSPRARCLSSPQSATSRTRRSAISPPTCGLDPDGRRQARRPRLRGAARRSDLGAEPRSSVP